MDERERERSLQEWSSLVRVDPIDGWWNDMRGENRRPASKYNWQNVFLKSRRLLERIRKLEWAEISSSEALLKLVGRLGNLRYSSAS